MRIDATITVNIHHHGESDPRIAAIIERQNTMSQAVDDLLAEVAAVKGKQASEHAALTKMREMIAALQAAQDSGDPAKIAAAVADLTAVNADMDAAIAENP